MSETLAHLIVVFVLCVGAYILGLRRGLKKGHKRGWFAQLYLIEKGRHPYMDDKLKPRDFDR